VLTGPSLTVLTALGILALLPVVVGADEVAAAQNALGHLGRDDNANSPGWWLAWAEEQAGLWGNPSQQAYSFAEIAELLANRDQIEAAVAVAKRIEHGPARLSARWRIAAAYARAGKLEAAAALARLSSEPDGRVEPDACVELNCHVAVTLAKVGRIEEAEKIATTLARRPSKWTGPWDPPANLVSVQARIRAACAAAYAKAGRADAYRKQIEKCEALARSIPVNVNYKLGSSDAIAPGEPDPINAIYKGHAVKAAVLARIESGDYRGAGTALELIPAGRSRDVIVRVLVDALAKSGDLKKARAMADAVTTDDHRDRAYLSLLAAHARAGDLAAANAVADRVSGRDCRAVAQMHLALATGGSGTAGDFDPQPPSDATSKERQARGMIPTAPVAARLRAKTYRALGRIQITFRNHSEVLDWIRTLPDAESRYHAYLGASEGIQ